MRAASAPRSRAGFTLVELLVVISVVSLLIALLAPALGGARVEARRLKSVTNARSIASTFQQVNDATGHYPFRKAGTRPEGAPPGAPAPPPGVLLVEWWPKGTVIGVSSHWAHEFLWPGMLGAAATWPSHYATWVSPGRSTALPESLSAGVPGEEGEEGPSIERVVSYRYAHSFVAKPALWRPGTDLNASLLAPIAAHEVQYPSQKVMVYDAELAYLRKAPPALNGHYRAATPMAFADGHADAKDPTEANPGFANPLNGGSTMAIHNTPEGVAGWDYR